MFSSRTFFTPATRNLLLWFGYPKEKLPLDWLGAANTYISNGARSKVGEIKSAKILHRKNGESPVHKSSLNKKDREDILSVRIKPIDGPEKTHHIYGDGTGTMSMGDERA